MIDLSSITGPIFYISPDIRRGLGLELALPNYHIITAYSEKLTEMVRRKGGKVFCLEERIGKEAESIKNSGQLLAHPRVEHFIKEKSQNYIPQILYFKPNLKLDLLCEKKGYHNLGNNSELNEMYENKINFFDITKKHLPDHHITGLTDSLSNIQFSKLKDFLGLPFIIQFGHGWAGKTTFIISNQNQLNNLRKKFPQTTAKIVKHIKGYTVLNNCCIYKNKVLVSPPAIQLNGFKVLSSNSTSTCGRVWPAGLLNNSQIDTIDVISQKIGLIMTREGYKGFFGLDFIIEEETGKVYLSENNARFTASTPFYTKLELANNTIPLMAYHVAAFSDNELPLEKGEAVIGSQVIIRNQKKESIRINDGLNPGIYALNQNKLTFKTEGYEIGKITKGDYIIIPERDGKEIKTDEEISRIETQESIIDRGGQLNPRCTLVIDSIRKLTTT